MSRCPIVINTIRAATLTTGGGLIVATALAVATVAGVPRQATAKQEYAQQTGLPCGQCHRNPSGGGTLKAFGERYRDNGHKLPKR
jgi:hypothetical protein